MSAIPINDKPFYNSDRVANNLAPDDMFDCYLEAAPGVGLVTRRRPGLALFADVGTGAPGDGLFYWDAVGKVLAVSDGLVFDVSADGVCTDITGAALTSGVPVTFADGQDIAGKPWLYLANGKLIYSKGGAPTVAPTDTNTPAATHVAWIKGRFVANEQGTNRFDFTDTNPATASKILSLRVLPGAGLAMQLDNRPVLASVAWTQSMKATGGTAPYTWSAVLGTAAAVTGTGETATLALTAVAAGTKSLVVTLTDSAATPVVITGTYTITFVTTAAALAIADPGTAYATVGTYEELPLTATGGIGPLTWSATGLPTGLTLVNIDAVSGVNTLAGSVAAVGSYPITLRVADSQTTPEVATLSFTLVISAQPTIIGPLGIATNSLPDATVGAVYTATLTGTGLAGEAIWTSSAQLPEGLTLSSLGVISGTPTGVKGVTTATFTLTDAAVTGILDPAYWSAVDNPLTCDAKGDKLAALFTAWQEIYAWGSQGLEIWQDDAVTPFSPITGAFSEGGIEAPYSVALADNTVFALCNIGGSRVVVKLQGRAPVVVSDAIGRVLAEMPMVADAIGDLISVGGVSLYLLSFPTANQSWAYDYKNDVWCRWGSFSSGAHHRFVGVHACYAKNWNRHLIQSRMDGKIYELRRDLFTDDGQVMQSFRRTTWIDHGTYNRKRCDQFYIKVKCGQADNAVMLLRYRDDGRQEWSQYLEIPLLPLGDGQFMAKMNRFGQYRSRQYEFLLSDDADMALVSVDVELTGMSS